MTLREFIEQKFNQGTSDEYLDRNIVIQHTVSNEGGVSLDGIAEITILGIIRPVDLDQPIIKMCFNTRLHEHAMKTVEWHDLAWCAQYEVLMII